MTTEKITIAALAEKLGVHKSTVSRAMDPARRHLISGDVLKRIEAAARQMGYRPNRAAAALSSGKSRMVGVLLPDITNPVFPPILRGIEDALSPQDYFPLVANTSSLSDGGQAVVERMVAHQVDGFVVATATRSEAWLEGLRKLGATLVLVNRTDGLERLPAVISDDALGMRLAIDHLITLGHRHIAHLAGPEDLSTGRGRRVGFERALHDHGLAPAAVEACAQYSVEAGEEATRRMLVRLNKGVRAPVAQRLSAIVAANDLLALGCLRALREMGLRVPQDISLIGHNDMPFVDQVSPALTTVAIPHYEMGYRAARLLIEMLEDRSAPPPGKVLLNPQLRIRESTAAPAGKAAMRTGGSVAKKPA